MNDSSAKRYGRHFFLAKVGESCQNMPQIPAHFPKKGQKRHQSGRKLIANVENRVIAAEL